MLTVMISDDSQFAFAGVNKGSMEMVTFDLGSLPVWTGGTLKGKDGVLFSHDN